MIPILWYISWLASSRIVKTHIASWWRCTVKGHACFNTCNKKQIMINTYTYALDKHGDVWWQILEHWHGDKGRVEHSIKFPCCIMAKFYAKRFLLHNGKFLCWSCLAVNQGKLLCWGLHKIPMSMFYAEKQVHLLITKGKFYTNCFNWRVSP